MASNPADLTDLLSKQTQYQAAKYGSGGLLDMAIAAYQAAFPKAPAANLMMGARQAFNIGQYNKSVQEAAIQQQLRQKILDANNTELLNKRLGTNISGPVDLAFANQSAPDIRKDNGLGFTKTFIDTGRLDTSQMQPGADYDPKIIENSIQRAGIANDNAATMQQLPQWMDTSKSPFAKFVQGQGGQPMLEQDPALSGLGSYLKTGISQTNPITPAEAFTVGIPNISVLQTGRKDELNAANNNETQILNREKFGLEKQKFGLQQQEFGEKKKGNYFKKYPPSGGNQNPFTIPNAQQNYIQGQISGIDDELKSMGFVDKGGKFSDKLRKVSSDPKIIRAQQLVAQRAMLQGQLGLKLPAGNPSSVQAPKPKPGKTIGSQYGVRY